MSEHEQSSKTWTSVDILDIGRATKNAISLVDVGEKLDAYPEHLLRSLEATDQEGFSTKDMVESFSVHVPDECRAKFELGSLVAMAVIDEICEQKRLDRGLYKQYVASDANKPVGWKYPYLYDVLSNALGTQKTMPEFLEYYDAVELDHHYKDLLCGVAGAYGWLEESDAVRTMCAGFTAVYWKMLMHLETASEDEARREFHKLVPEGEIPDEWIVAMLDKQGRSRPERILNGEIAQKSINDLDTEIFYAPDVGIEEALGRITEIRFDSQEESAEMVVLLQELMYPSKHNYATAEAAKHGGFLALEACSRTMHAAGENEYNSSMRWRQMEEHEGLLLEDGDTETIAGYIYEITTSENNTHVPPDALKLAEDVAREFCNSNESQMALINMFRYVYTSYAMCIE